MRALLLLLSLATLSLLASTTAMAQGLVSGGIILGLPQGEFGDNVDNVGFGFSGMALYQFPLTPIALGVEGTFLIYGRERDRVPLSRTIGNRITVDVITDNNIAQGHLVLRLMPPLPGRVTPYADGLLGFSYLFTESRVEDDDFGDDEPVFDSVNFDDFAFSYGFAGGLAIQLTNSIQGSLHLDLRVRYLLGSEAEYLQEGGFADPDGDGVFEADPDRSRTDILIPQIGVIYRF